MPAPEAEPLPVLDALHSTPARRYLSPEPIPDEVIWAVLDAAVRGPTGGNQQGWGWVVVTDPAIKQQMAAWYLEGWNRAYGSRREEILAAPPGPDGLNRARSWPPSTWPTTSRTPPCGSSRCCATRPAATRIDLAGLPITRLPQAAAQRVLDSPCIPPTMRSALFDGWGAGTWDLGLHALIDGVFAIALTLLVLDLPQPAHSTQLVHDLLHRGHRMWPTWCRS